MFNIDPWLIIVVIIGTVLFLALAIILGVRAHRRQVAAGKEDFIGKTAEVSTVMDPKGTVFIQGERWVGIADKGRIEPGEEVIITKVEGLKLRVTRKQ